MLSWVISMRTFTLSFSRYISSLGGFGGPEKDLMFLLVASMFTLVLVHQRMALAHLQLFGIQHTGFAGTLVASGLSAVSLV